VTNLQLATRTLWIATHITDASWSACTAWLRAGIPRTCCLCRRSAVYMVEIRLSALLALSSLWFNPSNCQQSAVGLFRESGPQVWNSLPADNSRHRRCRHFVKDSIFNFFRRSFPQLVLCMFFIIDNAVTLYIATLRIVNWIELNRMSSMKAAILEFPLPFLEIIGELDPWNYVAIVYQLRYEWCF